MHRFLVHLIFYPTLVYNLFWARVARRWQWWSRVDQYLILGALPFPSTVSELHEHGVRAVVNTCEEYAGPVTIYQQYEIRQLRVRTVDFTPPTLESVQQAVDFIEDHRKRGETVYVHCKAGRGRSATVVICWLIKHLNLTPSEAQTYLQQKRPQIVRHLHRRDVVQEFHRRHVRLNRAD